MKKILILAFCLLATNLFAQDEIANIYSSGNVAGMGFTGVASQNFDAGVIGKNPALAGFFAHDNNFGYSGTIYSQEYGIVPLDINHNAIFGGYKFNIGLNSPLAVGVHYSKYVESYDDGDWKTNTFSVGASMKTFVTVSIGFNYTHFSYDYFNGLDIYGNTAEDEYIKDMYSLGLHVSKDLSEFIPEKYKQFNLGLGNMYYNLNMAFGLSYNNMASPRYTDEELDIKYYDFKNLVMGYNFSFNLSQNLKRTRLDILKLVFAAEGRLRMGTSETGFGDFMFAKSLFDLTAPQRNMRANLGYGFEIMEMVILNYGLVRDGSIVGSHTEQNSVGYSTAGVTKLIAAGMQNGTVKDIMNNVSLTYYQCEYENENFKFEYDLFALNVKLDF